MAPPVVTGAVSPALLVESTVRALEAWRSGDELLLRAEARLMSSAWAVLAISDPLPSLPVEGLAQRQRIAAGRDGGGRVN